MKSTVAESAKPAMVAVPLALPAAGALSGALMCAASLVVSSRPMQMELPKMPKVSMPKVSLPKISLPKIPGQGKTEAEAKKTAAKPVTTRSAGTPKVRASSSVVSAEVPEAPTLADLTGEAEASQQNTWKRFPGRRLPGANLDGWKKVASELDLPNV